jgi:hypothetical protein
LERVKGIEPFAQANKYEANVEGCTQNCLHENVLSVDTGSRLYEILTTWNFLSAPIKDAVYALVKSQTGGAA